MQLREKALQLFTKSTCKKQVTGITPPCRSSSQGMVVLIPLYTQLSVVKSALVVTPNLC